MAITLGSGSVGSGSAVDPSASMAAQASGATDHVLQVPFQLHVRVVVPRGSGKRFEYVRQLQRVAWLIYDALIDVTGLTLAQPGGGQLRSHGGFAGAVAGMAVVPQIAGQPAQARVEGVYEVAREPIQNWADQTVISGGATWTGSRARPAEAVPNATILAEVKALKAAVDAALTAEIPDDVTWNVFRLTYSGIVFGDRAVHFPR